MTDYTITQEMLTSLFVPKIAETPSSHVENNSYRLDAGAYSSEAITFQNHIRSRKGEFKTLSNIAEVFGFGPFKRTYIEEAQYGIPLLTSSAIMELDSEPKIMAKANNPKWSQYQIKGRWILVSCSGTIGNVAITPKKWEGWGVSQDAIRILPKAGFLGFIYSFLRSQWMKDVIIGKKSGSVIDHIYEDDLKHLQMPILEESCVNQLESKINEVLNLREVSDGLLVQANFMLHEVTGLSEFQKNKIEKYNTEFSVESIFVASSKVLFGNHSGSEYRLDAHFYNLAAQQAITNLRKCNSDVKTIKEVANVFMGPRFKRNYVESAHGVPFLSGKNIVQIRPELKYLSNLQIADMQELIIKRGWSLVTCSGTIGRTCFVWDNYEEYAASQHILRVKPNEEEIDPAYLNAFLASRYGYEQILRFRHGSVIDEITDKQIGQVLVPCPSRKEQEAIGDMVRKAYELRAEAIRLEDEAQEILNKELKALPEGR